MRQTKTERNVPGTSTPIVRKTSADDVLPGTVFTQDTRSFEDAKPVSGTESTSKVIEFVSGCILPGTLREDRPTTTLDRDIKTESPTCGQSGTNVINNKTGITPDNKLSTHPAPELPHDVSMDTDEDFTDCGESLPDLHYPSTDNLVPEEPCDAVSKAKVKHNTSHSDDQPPSADDDEDLLSNIRQPWQTDVIFAQYADCSKKFEEWKKMMKKGTHWTDERMGDVMQKLSLSEWWKEARRDNENGRDPKWTEWKKKMILQLRYRYPDIRVRHFKAMADELHKQDKEAPTTLSLAATVSTEPLEDIEMAETDVPRAPHSTPIPVWIPSSPPMDVRTAVDNAVRASKVDPKDFTQLKKRVEELEEQVTETTDGIRDRLTRLGDIVYEDGIIITDLKWRMAEIQEGDEKSKVLGKRAYRKAKDKVQRHRYPTRYAEAQGDEILEISRKEFGDIEGRIKTVEERMEEMKKEKERLEEELAKVEALTPKLEALTASLNEFKMTQVKLNIGSFQEFARLRSLYADVVEPRLVAHGRDIAGLHARYQSLYHIAATLLGHQQQQQQLARRTSVRRTASTSPHPPMNVSNPIHKQIQLPSIRQIAAM